MKLLIAAVLILQGLAAFAGGPDDVLGVWKSQGERSRVELYHCGEMICGKVVWLKERRFMREEDGPIGEQKIDWRNPDPALQKRPIMGLQVIDGLTHTNDYRWENGLCYDPESVNSYKCNMKFIPPDKLKLRGYIGFSFIGRTYTLTR